MSSTLDLRVRDMCDADLSDVLKVESRAQINPWSRLSFEESLTRNHICKVVELFENGVGPQIVAYHVVCAVVDELHILNVVAAKEKQGIGLGHYLMQNIMDIAGQQKLKNMFLEVRASNEVAQSLYLKWKFEQIGLRKGYYSATIQTDGKRENALIFMRRV